MNALPLPALLPQRSLTLAGVAIAAGLVMIADPWLIMAVAVGLALGWLGWLNSAIGVGIVAATIPLQEAVLIPVGSAELTATQLTVLPLVGGWLAAWLFGRIALPLSPTLIAWVLVTGAMALSIVHAVDRGAWAREVYRWAIALALLAIASASIRHAADAWRVVIGVAIGILSTVGVAGLQVIRDDGPPSFSSGGLMRAYGHFGEPNPLAAYLEMSVLLLLPLALVMLRGDRRNLIERYGLFLVVIVGAGTLLLTQSRGGMLGFVAGGAVIAWWYAKWSRQLLLVGLLLTIPVLAFTAPGQRVVDRLGASVVAFGIDEQTTPENWSVHERIAHWRAGIAMAESEPVAGIGAGNFDARFREHTSHWRFRIPRGHAHNGPIHVAAQTGVVGLVAYLALFFVAGARIARGVLRAHCATLRALSLGAMGVLIAVAVHGQFDYLHGLSLNLAFVIALAMCEPSLQSRRNDLQPTGASA